MDSKTTDVKVIEQSDKTTVLDDEIEQSDKTTVLDDESHSNEKSEAEEVVCNSRIPVDQGWAWMVLLGSMLQMTLIMGLQKTSGIIFVAFQQQFNSTSSMTSLLSTVQNAAYCLSAPIVMTIGLKMTSFRSMLFIGNIIITLSYIISAYSDRIQILLLSYGVLQGIGTSFTLLPSVTILGIYFKQRRGLANSVAASGASVGGFILAPLITYLLQTYGYQGCILIIGAILLNGCISGALFRSQSFYQREETECLIQNGKSKGIVLPEDIDQLLPQTKRRSVSSNESTRTELFRSLPDISAQQVFRARTLTNTSLMNRRTNMRKMNSSPNSHAYNIFEYMKSSSLDMIIGHANGTCKEETNSLRKTEFTKLFESFAKSFDVTLFKNTLFLFLLFIGFTICSSSLLAAIYLAPYAHDIGIDSSSIATIVIVFSAVDLISRILLGMISDKGWLRPSTIIGIAAIVDGVAAQFLFLCSSFSTLMVYTVILGVFSGAYFALFPVVMVDFLTLEKLNSAIGFLALSNGAGISMVFYIMGSIRDITDSYITSYHVIGTMSLVGGVFILLLPRVQKCRDKTCEVEEP